LTGLLIAVLIYITGVTGAIMPCSILSEVTATIVGYSLNSVIFIAFDCVETLLVPGLGLTDDTMGRVFFVHLIAPTIVFLIVSDHVGNLHVTDYYDEDEIEIFYLLRREYMLEFFAIESFY
jgi:quinol-cytochrome oxidoreductase complex cytochrome b subunit